MAWNRVDIGTKLVMAVGENSPVICSGAPIYYKDASSDMQATPPHSYNVTGFYSGATKPDYDAISAIHGSGGIGLWSIVNNLTVNGDTLKIWNVNLGDTVCLEIRRQNSSTAQWRTVNHGDATGWRTLENFTQPSQGYGTMLEPCMNIGFFQNDDDNSIVLLTQRTYSNNANTYHYYYISSASPDAVDSANMIIMLSDVPPTTPDPYENGGYSFSDGGGGDQTFSSDTIGEPSAPTLSPQGSRLLTIYKVDSTKLAAFANYLWAGGIDFATLHNIFNDTMGAIISLAVCPYTPDANTAQNLWFGNFDSGVSAHIVDSQYDTIDCGSITLDEEYASALDYNPYCKIELCLPYCGNISLDPDEVMGTTVSIKYKVDLLTGACLACVFADGNLLVTVAGNILATIPVTNADHKAIVSSITGTAMAVVGAAAAVYSGGMSAPAGVAAASASTAANTLNMKERYNHGGTGNGNTALLGPQKPYLIIKWPRQCLPEQNGNYVGYPSMITETLGDLSGFTKVYQIHLENIPCTADERAELESILKGGVII